MRDKKHLNKPDNRGYHTVLIGILSAVVFLVTLYMGYSGEQPPFEIFILLFIMMVSIMVVLVNVFNVSPQRKVCSKKMD